MNRQSYIKHIFPALVMLAGVMLFCGVSASAAEIIDSGSCGSNITWEVDADGALTISGSGDMPNYSSTVFWIPWYEHRQSLSSLTIEDGVTSIGDYAFYDCCFTQASIAGSVKSIGDHSFEYTSLTEIVIPEGVTTIGNCAFRYNGELAEVTIPSSVVSMGYSVFEAYSNPQKVTFSGWNVPSIGSAAIPGHSSIVCYEGSRVDRWALESGHKTTYLPVSTVSSGTCGPNTEWILTSDGLLTISGEGGIYLYSKVEYIPWYWNRDSISAVKIEEGVSVINDKNFMDCKNVVEVMLPESLTNINDSAFNGCSSLMYINLPEKLEYISNAAFYGCSSLENITIPANITGLSSSVFRGCTSLTKVILPEGLNTIGVYAFENCGNLEEINIPDGVTEIGMFAFHNCDRLTAVVLPDSVTSIGNRSFSGCRGLTSLTLPGGITSIGEYAFENCGNILFRVPEDTNAQEWCVQNQQPFGFAGGVSFPEENVLILPAELKEIGNEAFVNVAAEGIMVPDGTQSIAGRAFTDDMKRICIRIPGSVTSIAENAFAGMDEPIIFCGRGSEAYNFAVANGLPLELDQP